MRRERWHEENGEIMIESMLVIIPTLFVMVFLISLGFLLYQQWNVQYAADYVASKLSAGYAYTDSDLKTGCITTEQLTDRPLYRNSFDKEKLAIAANDRGQAYGNLLLNSTNFASPVEEESIVIEVEEDSLARRHIHVTVSGTYKIPFGEGLEIFGINSVKSYQATSIAECVDISDFVGTVNFTKNAFTLFTGGESKIVKAIDSWIKVFQHIRGYFN